MSWGKGIRAEECVWEWTSARSVDTGGGPSLPAWEEGFRQMLPEWEASGRRLPRALVSRDPPLPVGVLGARSARDGRGLPAQPRFAYFPGTDRA